MARIQLKIQWLLFISSRISILCQHQIQSLPHFTPIIFHLFSFVCVWGGVKNYFVHVCVCIFFFSFGQIKQYKSVRWDEDTYAEKSRESDTSKISELWDFIYRNTIRTIGRKKKKNDFEEVGIPELQQFSGHWNNGSIMMMASESNSYFWYRWHCPKNSKKLWYKFRLLQFNKFK